MQPSHPSLWGRLSRWVREGVMAMATVYLFPLAILAIFIPLAFLIKGLVLAAGWVGDQL